MRIGILFLSALTLLTAPLSAQWTAGAASVEKNETVTALAGPHGRAARVVSQSALTPADAAIIGGCLDAIWAIPGLQGRDALVRADDSGFRIVVTPASFSYGGRDFVPLLPSGLAFYYQSSLFYDVTLKVDSYMPKVTGAYISPEGFLDRLDAAVKMPDLFMEDRGSLQTRVERLEAALMAVIAKSPPKIGIDRELVTAIMNARHESPDITPAETVSLLKEQGLRATVKQVSAVFFVYFGVPLE
jgi:hypothetical protein